MAEKRTELVTTRMTPTERRRVEAAARTAGASRSDFVRKAADRRAREELRRLAEGSPERGEP